MSLSYVVTEGGEFLIFEGVYEGRSVFKWIHKFEEIKTLGKNVLTLVVPEVEDNSIVMRKLHIEVISNREVRSWSTHLRELIKEFFEECKRRRAVFADSMGVFIELVIYRVDMAISVLSNLIDKYETQVLKRNVSLKTIVMLRKKVIGIRNSIISLQRLLMKSGVANLTYVSDELRYVSSKVDGVDMRVSELISLSHLIKSDETNIIVKKLTAISTIFLPLTLIASIYGMNFKYMPELYHPLGYFATLIGMTILAIALVIMFRKLKWL